MEGRVLQFGGFILDGKRSRLLDQDGREVRLRPKSFDMLSILLGRAGEVVSKDELLKAVWGDTHLSDDGLVQCVRDVRVAICDDQKRVLRTVPKRGYLLDVQPVEVCVNVGLAGEPEAHLAAASVLKHHALFLRPGRILAAAVVALAIGSATVLFAKYELAGNPSAPATIIARSGLDTEEGEHARQALAELHTQGINPIMVLPFAAADSSPAATVADSLSDELIGSLSLVPSLRVISRATSQFYRGKSVDVAALGHEIGVRYVVEGSVHVHENVAQVNIALTDASDRVQMWSAQFDRPLTELQSLRRDIIRGVARQLQLGVFLAEEAKQAPHPSADPTLDDLLARGWAALVRSPGEGVTASAAAYFEQAIKRAPGNESAQLGLAGSQIIPATQQLGRKDHVDLKGAAAQLETVLAANPRQSLALLYRGMLRRLNNDLPGARDDVLSAIDSNPSFAVAYGQAGHIFYRLGEYDRGLEYIRYAMRLSPRDPGLGVWSFTAGMIELERGNDDAAFEWFDSAASLIPRNVYARLGLIAVRTVQGDPEGAQDELEKLRRQAPWITPALLKDRLGIEATPVNTRPRLIAALEQALKAQN